MKRLLQGAGQEAGNELPGAEHLLLAALRLPDGTAGAAVSRLGVTSEQVRQAVEAIHADALATVGIEAVDAQAATRPNTGAYRSTGTAQETFRRGVAISKGQGTSLKGAHIVLAVAELHHGTAPRALARLGLDTPGLVAAAHDALGGSA